MKRLPVPSVAQGMAAFTALLAVFTVGHLCWTLWPQPAAAPSFALRCASPVEVHEAGYDRLGCADEAALTACGARALDRIIVRDGVCEREVGGMRQAWRVITRQKLDVNRATVGELTMGPDLGRKLAEAVVEERQAHGPFASLDDLRRVPGIGPLRAQRLRTWLMVSAAEGPS